MARVIVRNHLFIELHDINKAPPDIIILREFFIAFLVFCWRICFFALRKFYFLIPILKKE